jgi:arylsulfatase A-like enzyme
MSRRTTLLWTILLLASRPAAAAEAPSEAGAERAARPPNIVVFLADDLGWADTSLTGSSFYETPNLERLASQGTYFSAAYVTPVCNATRAGLLSGRYPGARLKLVGAKASRSPSVPDRDDPAFPRVRPERVPALMQDEVTLAEALRKADYATWFAGKWDLGIGHSGPEKQGFDRALEVGKRGVERHFAPYGVPALLDTEPGVYLADRLTDEVINWIHWEQRGGRPFFLYLAHHSVHAPWQGKPELVEKYRAKAAAGDPRAPQRNPVMGAMIESLDESLGRILDTLDEIGIADNTIVVFLSDNGAVTGLFEGSPLTSNAPLRGSKGSVLEGGVRVPLVVKWPGLTREAATLDTPVSHVDLFPTLLAAAGAPLPDDRKIDGEDLGPLLRGERDQRSSPVFVHFPIGEQSSSVRSGRWKLIRYHARGPRGEPRDALYDLEADVGEANDLAASNPAQAAELAALLDTWIEETGALLPVPNPAYRGPAEQP